MSEIKHFKLIQSLRHIPGKLLKFPVELLLSITFFVLILIGIKDLDNSSGELFILTILTFIPQFVLTCLLNRPGWKWRIPYILAYFLWIPVVTGRIILGVEILLTYLLVMIALFVGKRKMDNTGYARRIVHVVKNIMLACAIGLVLVVLVFAVTWSVKELFAGGDVYYKIAGRISIFVGVVIVPMLSCIFVDGQEPETKPAGILGVFLNYIFTPALLVYTLILYVYTIRILIRWELPQGGVAYMVLAYMGFAMICYLLGYHTEKHPFKCFYRWLPLISVPFIILLWTGVLRRIADYGFTTGRVYLLAASTLVTIFDVLMFFERTRDFRKMTIALGVVAFVLNIPGISAINIGIRVFARPTWPG